MFPRFSRAFLLISLLNACTPTQYLRAPEAAECQLDAVAYRTTAAGEAEGVTSRMRITIRPTNEAAPRVAVFEEFSGGTGDMWRTSTWVAAVHASRMVNAPLRYREISVSVGGFIDGPSAGALMTAGMAAALRGIPVRPDVTMTGTVNPDGSVGPVGGIQHKMRAAARAGKRVFGYPAGLRMQREENGELVDLRELAVELGIEAHEMNDVYDSFALLTGHNIARQQPLPEAHMEPTREVEQRMRAQMTEWEGLIVEQLRAFGRQPREYADALMPSAENVAGAWEESQNYLAQGLISMAYHKARVAAIAGDGLEQSVRLLQGLVEQDMGILRNELRSMHAVVTSHDEFLAAVRRLPLNTVGDALAVMGAYSSALLAKSSIIKASIDENRANALLEAVMDGSLEGEEAWSEIGMTMTSAAIWYQSARFVLLDGVRAWQLGMNLSSTAPIDVAALRELAHTTTVSAKAVLDNYEALIVAPAATSNHVAQSALTDHLITNDSDYRSAKFSINVALNARDASDMHELLFALVAAERGFLDASMLLMRDYSLGASRDERGTVTGVRHEMAFRQALRSAENNARSGAAALLTRSGEVPDALSAVYQRAAVLREGSLDDRFVSLRGFWSIALQANTAEHLVAR